MFIEPEDLEERVVNRYKRYAEIEKNEVLYDTYMTDDADIVLVSYGITSRICKTAVTMARSKGIKAGLFRPISLWPYPSSALLELSEKTKSFLVCELNMGQMVDDVKLAVNCKKPVEFFGRTGGMMPNPEDIFNAIKKMGVK